MKPQPYEGNLKAYWVPTIADKAAPTAAEMTAGIDLSDQLTADGVSPNHTENTVSTDMLSGFIKQSIGTEGLTFNLRFLRDFEAATDTVYDNFDARGKDGFLVLSETGGGQTSGDVVEVYPAQAGRRKRIASTGNAHIAFSVLVTVDDDYVDDAVVAA